MKIKMKRPRDDDTISHPKIPRMNNKGEKLTGKTSNNDRLTSLAMDLKLILVSFLTRSETLRLASCSIRLKEQLNSDEVWKAFIKRLSPSLLALPMKSVANWRDKLKVIILKQLEPQLTYNYKSLQLHYVLKINGVGYSSTLSNPCRNHSNDLRYAMKFHCGVEFKSIIEELNDHHDISILVLLIYDGKTGVLIPETKIDVTKIEPPFHYVHVSEDMSILIVLNFKHSWTYSAERDAEDWYISGISSVDFVFVESGSLKDSINTKLKRTAKKLQWY
jgi:hypothetical protein